jgi:hypothetical protein
MSDIQKRLSIFGMLSLLFPLVGIPVSYMNTTPMQEGWGWGGAMHLLMKITLMLLCGIVSACIGLSRSEKWIALSLFGLILNILPIMWFLAQ